MIDIYYKSIEDPNFTQINEFKAGSWLHVEHASLNELTQIAELAEVNLEDLTDSMDKYETPRIEQKNNNVIIFVRHPTNEEEGLHTATLAIILTKSYFITITPQKSKLLEIILASKNSMSSKNHTELLFNLLFKINQDFNTQIKNVRYSVIDQEKKIKNIDNSTILMLTKNEEKLNQYLACLLPMRFLIDSLSSERYLRLHENDRNILEDLSIGFTQSEDFCRINVKSIRSLRDAYQILFTNDLNKTIKLLTAITIIVTIPSIITSLYGMNVKLPLADMHHAFTGIVIIIFLSCLASTWIFYRKKWL
jgi:magnesium transporter